MSAESSFPVGSRVRHRDGFTGTVQECAHTMPKNACVRRDDGKTFRGNECHGWEIALDDLSALTPEPTKVGDRFRLKRTPGGCGGWQHPPVAGETVEVAHLYGPESFALVRVGGNTWSHVRVAAGPADLEPIPQASETATPLGGSTDVSPRGRSEERGTLPAPTSGVAPGTGARSGDATASTSDPRDTRIAALSADNARLAAEKSNMERDLGRERRLREEEQRAISALVLENRRLRRGR